MRSGNSISIISKVGGGGGGGYGPPSQHTVSLLIWIWDETTKLTFLKQNGSHGNTILDTVYILLC